MGRLSCHPVLWFSSKDSIEGYQVPPSNCPSKLFLRKCWCLEAMGDRYRVEMPHLPLGQLEGLMGECGLLPLDSGSAWLSCLSQTSEIARLHSSPEASRAVRLSGNHSASLPCIEASRADLAFCDQWIPWVCVSGMLASSSP